jgi:hypothetical protein
VIAADNVTSSPVKNVVPPPTRAFDTVTDGVDAADCTVTVSVSVRNPFDAVTSNVKVWPDGDVTGGTTNVGLAVVEPDSVTEGPPVCTHEYDTGSAGGPLGSVVPVASSVTVLPATLPV